MNMQVEDGLTAAWPDVDDHAVVLEPGPARRFRHEFEQALRLVRVEVADVAERVHVALGDYEEMRGRLGRDVADRHEPVALAHVVALAVEPAEETVVGHGADRTRRASELGEGGLPPNRRGSAARRASSLACSEGPARGSPRRRARPCRLSRPGAR